MTDVGTPPIAVEERSLLSRWVPLLTGASTFCLVLAVALVVDWEEGQRRRAEEHARIANELSHVAGSLSKDLDAALGELRSLAFWVALEPELAHRRFDDYSRYLLDHYSTLRSTTLLPGDVISRAFPPNPALVGLDVGRHPQQGRAVEEMKRLRDAVVTGPIHLTQGGRGLILRAPVWLAEQSEDFRYWGHVSLVFDLARVDQSLADHGSTLALGLVLADADGDGVTAGLRLGHEAGPASVQQVHEFAVPGERWRLLASASRSDRNVVSNWLGTTAGFLLALASGLGAGLLALASGRLRASNRKLELLATTDPLTGSHNRRHMVRQIHNELSRLARGGMPLSAILLDIDHFKRVNDEHGHSAGDETLRSVVRLIQNELREHDTLGRWGGEEFLIVAPQTDTTGARALAERLRSLIERTPILILERRLYITASFGIATAAAKDTVESLVERCDGALYRAKRRGRNRCEVNSGARAQLTAVSSDTESA